MQVTVQMMDGTTKVHDQACMTVTLEGDLIVGRWPSLAHIETYMHRTWASAMVEVEG